MKIVLEDAWHAADCGGTCDGCGYISHDLTWHPGPCPEDLKAWQVEYAEG